MKIGGLEGDYCPQCAGALQRATLQPGVIIVLADAVCHQSLMQSGDLERLEEMARAADSFTKAVTDTVSTVTPGYEPVPKKKSEPKKAKKSGRGR